MAHLIFVIVTMGTCKYLATQWWTLTGIDIMCDAEWYCRNRRSASSVSVTLCVLCSGDSPAGVGSLLQWVLSRSSCPLLWWAGQPGADWRPWPAGARESAQYNDVLIWFPDFIFPFTWEFVESHYLNATTKTNWFCKNRLVEKTMDCSKLFCISGVDRDECAGRFPRGLCCGPGTWNKRVIIIAAVINVYDKPVLTGYRSLYYEI